LGNRGRLFPCKIKGFSAFGKFLNFFVEQFRFFGDCSLVASSNANPNRPNQMTATAKNRTFKIESSQQAGKFLAERLIEKGFDGQIYTGTSDPIGKQRKHYTATFFRRADGEFVNVG